jgi:hypothetical protein
LLQKRYGASSWAWWQKTHVENGTTSLRPGQKEPERGYEWYTLRQGDDEIGLIQAQVIYTENVLATLQSKELHPDALHVRKDELEFSADLIKRNIDRLDRILAAFYVRMITWILTRHGVSIYVDVDRAIEIYRSIDT